MINIGSQVNYHKKIRLSDQKPELLTPRKQQGSLLGFWLGSCSPLFLSCSVLCFVFLCFVHFSSMLPVILDCQFQIYSTFIIKRYEKFVFVFCVLPVKRIIRVVMYFASIAIYLSWRSYVCFATFCFI